MNKYVFIKIRFNLCWKNVILLTAPNDNMDKWK